MENILINARSLSDVSFFVEHLVCTERRNYRKAVLYHFWHKKYNTFGSNSTFPTPVFGKHGYGNGGKNTEGVRRLKGKISSNINIELFI